MKYEHGTSSAYIHDKCRCDLCRAEVMRLQRERSKRTEPAFVSATPAREHLRFLAENGMGMVKVAKAAGISEGCVRGILHGEPGKGKKPSKRISRKNSEAILAVSLPAPEVKPIPVQADPYEIFDRLAEAMAARLARTWQNEAACRNRPSYIWFPAKDDKECLAQARQICASCIVRGQCLEQNINENDGIYAGTTPRQRKTLRSKRKLALVAA